jgi:transglutaminase-like putative cysteine protease
VNDRLFPLLLLLTLLDLAFVQATGIVGAAGLAPMWVLALAAMRLRRLQRSRVYRAAWNGGVVLVFALLVHHATTSGLLHMLEDGLLLAALCQVHLLNNVGERQRPDLIFFNSFLIAFVTSFFAPDLTWSVLFVAHAFALVPALQVHQATRSGSADPRLLRAARRDAVPRTLAIVALTALAFVAVPRDFKRPGWIGESLVLQPQLEAGLAERIRVDDERATALSDTVVARIVPATGESTDVPAHWRANTFATFDGSSWSPLDVRAAGSRFATDPPWRGDAEGQWRRDVPPGARSRFTVELAARDADRLPVPLAAAVVAPPRGERVLVDPKVDGSLRLQVAGGGGLGPCRYTVDAGSSAGRANVGPRARALLVALPDRGVPAGVRALAAQLRAADASALARAAASCDWLQQNRRYQLPGEPGFARNLGEFVLGSGAGHCEYFATALALLLRAQDVPCRVVGGYLAHEWDEAARAIVVRGRHAHAWVEVLDEDGAWHTFDATPAADVRSGQAPPTTWTGAFVAWLERGWAAVTSFDGAARTRWLRDLAALPRERPLAVGGVLAALIALAVVRRRRHRAEPTAAALRAALRAAQLSLRPGETPRELLSRAVAAGIRPAALGRLREAARVHEARRYAAARD